MTILSTTVKYHLSLDRKINYSTGATTDAKTTGEPVPIRNVRAIELLLFFGKHKETATKTGSGVVYLAPGIFAPDAPRQIAECQGADIILLDFDGPEGLGDDNRWIAGKLAALRAMGIAHACATSFSHGRKSAPGHSRWRIILIADRRIEPEEYKACWLHWASWFEARPDKSQDHLASVFYPPTCPVGESRKWTRLYTLGAAFSVDEAFASGSRMRKDDLYPSASSKPNRETIARARDTLRAATETATRPAPITVAGDLPADTVLHTPSGSFPARSLRPGEKVTQIHSIWRKSLSGNPSCVATCHDDGRVYVYDFGDSTGRFVSGWVDEWSTSSSTFFSKDNHLDHSNKVVSETTLWDKVVELPGGPMIQGNYLLDQLPVPELDQAGCYALACPMGAGKTHALASLTAGEGVLYVGDTVALGRSVADAMGLTMHTDIPHGKESDFNRVYACINSLYRFIPASMLREAGTYLLDNLVIDETPAVLAALHSSTMHGHGPQAAEAMAVLAAVSKRVWLASADFSKENLESAINLLRKYRPDLHVTLFHRPVEQGTRTIRLVSGKLQEASIIESMRSHDCGAGKPNLVASFTSKEAPAKWTKIAEKLRPDARILWVSQANSATPEIKAALANPEQLQRDYDFIFFSPSIKTGVSFPAPVAKYFQYITTPMPATSLLQTTMRCRNLLDPVVNVCIRPSTASWTTDPETLRKLCMGMATATEKQIAAADVHFGFTSDLQRTPTNPWFFNNFIQTEIENRKSKNNLLREYVRCAHRHGFVVVDDRKEEVVEPTKEEKKELSEIKNEAKKEIMEERIEALMTAPVLTEEEADELMRSPSTSAGDQAAVERHLIETFYDSEIDEKLIRNDDKGRLRSKIKSYNALKAYDKGMRQVPRYLDRLDASRKERTEYAHYTVKAKVASEFFREVLGVRLWKAEGLTITAEALTEALAPILQDAKRVVLLREVLHVNVTAKTLENPVKWFGEVLKRYGVHWLSSRPRSGGDRARQYTILLHLPETLGEANYRRILDMTWQARARGVELDMPCLSDNWQEEVLQLLAA